MPSRLPFQTKSSSDNNIRQRLFVDGESSDNEEMQESEDNNGGLVMQMDSPVDQALESKVVNTLPPEKVPSMMNYLASLPTPDEDLGIMVPSPSDSGSPFSSPLLTPPDIEGVQLALRDFQEAEKDRLEREKGLQGGGGDTLSVPHARVNRAVSLPTSVHPLAGEAYPRTTPLPEKEEDGKETSGETPEGEMKKIALKQSVTERVREIEKKSQSLLRSERPASAGSRKYMTSSGVGGVSLSLASSEESLSSKKMALTSDDGKEKRRSISPVNSKILEDDTHCGENSEVDSMVSPPPAPPPSTSSFIPSPSQALIEQQTTPSAGEGSSLHTGDGNDHCLGECQREVPFESSPAPPSSSSSYLCMSGDNNRYIDTDSTKSPQAEMDPLLLGNNSGESDESPLDPGKTYELAQQRSLLLAEMKKNKSKLVSSDDGADPSLRGVRELCGVFGDSKRGKGSLKRTQSLKERRVSSLIPSKHKRTPSVSTVPSDNN